jgi:hypothetical protein
MGYSAGKINTNSDPVIQKTSTRNGGGFFMRKKFIENFLFPTKCFIFVLSN